MKRYALVQDGEIVKFRNVDEDDLILTSKLVAHNYLPVVEAIKPEIDRLTQTLSDSYEILEDTVERRWTIIARSTREIQTLKEEKIKQDTMNQIERVWDDVDWQLKVIAVIEKKHTDEAALVKGK